MNLVFAVKRKARSILTAAFAVNLLTQSNYNGTALKATLNLKMKATILFIFLLLLFVAPASAAAQQVCPLELKDAPVFFNLKLGMTEAEVRGVLGTKLKFKPKKKGGERSFFQNFITKPPPAILTEVRALYLRFYDHRIYQIEIFYENRAERQTLAEFIRSLAANQSFPYEFWTIKTDGAMVRCVDFTIVADQVLNPRIELTDETNRALLLKARQKDF